MILGFVYKNHMETKSDIMSSSQVLSETGFVNIRVFALCTVVFRVVDVDCCIWVGYTVVV